MSLASLATPITLGDTVRLADGAQRLLVIGLLADGKHAICEYSHRLVNALQTVVPISALVQIERGHKVH